MKPVGPRVPGSLDSGLGRRHLSFAVATPVSCSNPDEHTAFLSPFPAKAIREHGGEVPRCGRPCPASTVTPRQA